MPLKTITDRKGHQFRWDEYEGHGALEIISQFLIPEGFEAKIKQIKTLAIRDDDIMVCTFPKAGTHWIWEIVSMVISGRAEYETRTKEAFMLEFQSPETVASQPSPRILNTHFAVSCLPEQIHSKKTKIIHVMRNPKDVVTSFFYHFKQFNALFPDNKPFETFSEFLPYITGEYGVYLLVSMWRYLKEFDKLSKESPGQVLTLHFEDMKANPTEAVRKVAQFLNKDLSDDVVETIAEKCSFDNLKAANHTLKKLPENIVKRAEQKAANNEGNDGKKPPVPPIFYRKGTVGDWKHHFTVAENEEFDRIIKEQLKDCDLNFTYTL